MSNRVEDAITPVLKQWGVRSMHGEWSDAEAQRDLARRVAAALAEAGIGDLAAERSAAPGPKARGVEGGEDD